MQADYETRRIELIEAATTKINDMRAHIEGLRLEAKRLRLEAVAVDRNSPLKAGEIRVKVTALENEVTRLTNAELRILQTEADKIREGAIPELRTLAYLDQHRATLRTADASRSAANRLAAARAAWAAHVTKITAARTRELAAALLDAAQAAGESPDAALLAATVAALTLSDTGPVAA